MMDGWALWLLLVGLGIGAGFVAVLLVRLPRQDDDIGEAERRTEAAWIAATIERHGGVAPPSLVEEVLELHGAYLATLRPPAPPGVSAPPVAPAPPAQQMTAPPATSPPPPAPLAPPPGYAPLKGPPPTPPGPPPDR